MEPQLPVPGNNDLPDAIASAYEKKIALGLKKAAVSLEGGLNEHEGDLGEDVVMRSECEMESDSEGSELELSSFMLEARNVLEDD